MRRRYLTPPALPEETLCRGLVIPASQEWLAVFSQALLDTTYPYFYEQLNPTDLTPEAAAAAAYEVYTAWLTATCGGDCLPIRLPGGRRIYRINTTTNRIEYVNETTGEWEEPTGEEAIPDTPARSEPTDYEKRCAAATNAVYVLKLTWDAGRVAWANNIAANDAMVDTSLAVAGAIGGVFYPPLAGMLALTQLGWEIVYHAYELLSAFSWDEAFSDLLTCAFLQNASVDNGVVSFYVPEILREMWRAAFSAQAYLLMVGQLEYFLISLGPQAINAAGALTVEAGDCVQCGTWRYELTNPQQAGFVLTRGYFSAVGDIWENAVGGIYQFDASLTVDTSPSQLRRVSYYVQHTSYTGYDNMSALPSEGPLSQKITTAGGANGWIITDDRAEWYSNSDETIVRIWNDAHPTNRNHQVNSVRLYGTGVSPFGMNNF